MFCTSKGGAGKTTLALNIAATLSGKVLLLDADPQQSAVKWADAAPEESPLPMAVMGYTGDKIHREIKKVMEEYQYIIVDTPPSALAVSTVTRSVLLAADLAIIPVIPSPLDIWKAVRIASLVMEINELRQAGQVKPLHARLLINRLKPRTSFGTEINDALKGIGVAVCATAVHEREAYKHAALDGTSVHHVRGAGGQAASADIKELAQEITNALK
jgi:chromosome partitioning protein